MLKITVLGLVLAAVALSGVMSVAISVTSAETVPSPLQQVRDGIMASKVVCSNDRVLMVSQSGMPACVYATSTSDLLQRGFTLVLVQDTPVDISNELPARYIYESDIKLGGHAFSGSMGLAPVSHRIEIPSSFTIGQNVTIPYSFSWQYENGTTTYEQQGRPEPGAYEVAIVFVIPN